MIARLHIVAIAALGTLTFGFIFTGHRLWLLAGFCALDWFLVNLLNRVVDLEEDVANAIPGTAFVERNQRVIRLLGFGLLGVSFVVGHLLVPAITLLRVVYHLLGLSYNWPLLPGGRRIKQLYFFKNTASATGFMITVFGYPLASAGSLLPPITIGLTAAFFFLFELSYEVIYDLRDAAGDAVAGVKSYPVVHGQRGAVRIIDGLICCSMLTLGIGYGTGHVPWRIAVMLVAPAAQLVIYKRALRQGRITTSLCVGLTWFGAGLLGVYHVWDVLGLPGA